MRRRSNFAQSMGSRERQDEFAAVSHQRADEAWAQGRYDDLTVRVPNVDLTRDETIRGDTTTETLGGLKTVFRKSEGTVTAGNASPMSDGASAAWIGSGEAEEVLGLAAGATRWVGSRSQRTSALRVCTGGGNQPCIGQGRHSLV